MLAFTREPCWKIFGLGIHYLRILLSRQSPFFSRFVM